MTLPVVFAIIGHTANNFHFAAVKTLTVFGCKQRAFIRCVSRGEGNVLAFVNRPVIWLAEIGADMTGAAERRGKQTGLTFYGWVRVLEIG